MADNATWKLEEFVDSLVVELDKTRETLAVKAINKPLTYTVKDIALDLNVFSSYDGDEISFVTAQPGQEGASKVTIQLSSITDQQVRATTKDPSTKGDLTLEDAKVDPATQRSLRKLGVKSIRDLESIENKNVDLKKVAETPDIDYTKLANLLQKTRRNRTPPRVTAASLDDEGHAPLLVIDGEHLAVDPAFPPVAVVDDALADVVQAGPERIVVRLPTDVAAADAPAEREVVLTTDPFAVIRMNVRTAP